MRCVRKSSCRRIHSFYLSSQKDRGSSLRWGGDYRKIRFQGEDEFSFGHVKFEVSNKNLSRALTSVAEWIEYQPANQKVTGLIPGQGTCLGCRMGPQCGAREWQPHTDVSLPLFLLPFPSL